MSPKAKKEIKELSDLPYYKPEFTEQLKAMDIETLDQLLEALEDEEKHDQIVDTLKGIGPKHAEHWIEVIEESLEGEEEAPAEAAAKERGWNVTAEACPHHFTLTDDAVRSFDTNTKMNPPLRTREDVEALPQALAENEQLDSRRIAHRRRFLTHEAMQHESLEVAIDGRLRRREFACEFGDADRFSQGRESLQQAQREAHRLVCRTFDEGPRLPCWPAQCRDFRHVSSNETVFQYISDPHRRLSNGARS